MPNLCKGLRLTRNSSDHPVLWLHYSADPLKDPETEAGKKWVTEEKKAIMADLNPQKWRAEYEMDFMAGSGDLVFPTFLRDRNRYVVPNVKLDETFLYYGGLDWGTRNYTVFTIVAEDPKGRFYAIHEQLWKMAVPAKVAEAIFTHPLYDLLQWIACDPTINHSLIPTPQGHTTISEFLSQPEYAGDYAIQKLMPAHGRDDSVFINLVRNMWTVDPPRLFLTESCPNLIQEISNLTHVEHHGEANPKEKIVDRNNHSWDTLKYILLSHPHAAAPRAPKPKYGTVGYYNEVADLARAIAEQRGTSVQAEFNDIWGTEL